MGLIYENGEYFGGSGSNAQQITSEAYNALTEDKKKNGDVYFVDAESDKYIFKTNEDKTIIVRLDKTSNDIKWFFNDFVATSGEIDVPSNLVGYVPSLNNSEVVMTAGFDSVSSEVQTGWLGFYNNGTKYTIRFWSVSTTTLITGKFWGVLDNDTPRGDRGSTEKYFDPYEGSGESHEIYYMGNKYSGGGKSDSEREYIGELIPRVSSTDSRITASGQSSYSSATQGQPYMAFDGISPESHGNDFNNAWCAAENDASPWIQYNFGSPKYFEKIAVKVFSHYSGDWDGDIKVLGSVDGLEWVNVLKDEESYPITARISQPTSYLIDLDSTEYYQHIRVQGTKAFNVAYQPSCDFDEIQVYGGKSKTEGHTYSTEEQVVGTWIDGKTLYEKTVHIEGIYGGNATVSSDLFPSNMDIVITQNVSIQYIEFGTRNALGSNYMIYPFNANNTFKLSIGSGNYEMVIDVVIRYTKTTD